MLTNKLWLGINVDIDDWYYIHDIFAYENYISINNDALDKAEQPAIKIDNSDINKVYNDSFNGELIRSTFQKTQNKIFEEIMIWLSIMNRIKEYDWIYYKICEKYVSDEFSKVLEMLWKHKTSNPLLIAWDLVLKDIIAEVKSIDALEWKLDLLKEKFKSIWNILLEDNFLKKSSLSLLIHFFSWICKDTENILEINKKWIELKWKKVRNIVYDRIKELLFWAFCKYNIKSNSITNTIANDQDTFEWREHIDSLVRNSLNLFESFITKNVSMEWMTKGNREKLKSIWWFDEKEFIDSFKISTHFRSSKESYSKQRKILQKSDWTTLLDIFDSNWTLVVIEFNYLDLFFKKYDLDKWNQYQELIDNIKINYCSYISWFWLSVVWSNEEKVNRRKVHKKWRYIATHGVFAWYKVWSQYLKEYHEFIVSYGYKDHDSNRSDQIDEMLSNYFLLQESGYTSYSTVIINYILSHWNSKFLSVSQTDKEYISNIKDSDYEGLNLKKENLKDYFFKNLLSLEVSDVEKIFWNVNSRIALYTFYQREIINYAEVKSVTLRKQLELFEDPHQKSYIDSFFKALSEFINENNSYQNNEVYQYLESLLNLNE